MRALLVLLVACAPLAPFQPVTVTAPADAYSKAMRVLTDRGETIETKDEPAGLIVTKWGDDSKRMGSDFHFRWSITIADGKATVVSQCQMRAGDDPWSNCARQPDERNQQAKAIADAIAR